VTNKVNNPNSQDAYVNFDTGKVEEGIPIVRGEFGFRLLLLEEG